MSMFRAGSSTDIQPRGQFRALIMRERIRADRNQHLFSLLLFTTGAGANSIGVQHLARVLADRVRLTDEVGWFDNRRIGVLLPYTSAGGAQTLAEDVCKTITTRAAPPEYTVHTYPSKWFAEGNGHPDQYSSTDFSPGSKTKRSQRPSAPAKDGDDENTPLSSEIASAYMASKSGTLTQGIEPFFAGSLPRWKRAMDVVCASLGLVVLSPLLILIALIVKVSSPGPVFFKQPRVGRSGRLFTMLKFRTMKPNIDKSAHRQYMCALINGGSRDKPMTKLDDVSQLTAVGKILRGTSIDELPQLINVLRGEMTLVGPRPPVPYEVDAYSHWHHARFDVVPGMTGLWQVSGKNRLAFSEMVRLDIRYARKLSVCSDVAILLKTPLAIASDIKDNLTARKQRSLSRKVGENA